MRVGYNLPNEVDEEPKYVWQLDVGGHLVWVVFACCPLQEKQRMNRLFIMNELDHIRDEEV